MNRVRLAAMIVMALILIIHWALPGVARADIEPVDIEELVRAAAKAAIVLLVSLLLLTILIEGSIVVLPLRRALRSVGTFALMVVVVNTCTYLLGLSLLLGGAVLVGALASRIPIAEEISLIPLYLLVEAVVTIIEVIWIGAIARRRLTPSPEASRHPTVTSVRRLVVVANLVTAALGPLIVASGLVDWLADLFT